MALSLFLPLGEVAAHALLIESAPDASASAEFPPARVVAHYSQELETRLSSIRVFDDSGEQVDNGDGRVDLDDPDRSTLVVTLPDELASGRYTVRWAVVSAEDGDATEGEFYFGVGRGTLRAAEVVEANAVGGASARYLALGVGMSLLTGCLVWVRSRRVPR